MHRPAPVRQTIKNNHKSLTTTQRGRTLPGEEKTRLEALQEMFLHLPIRTGKEITKSGLDICGEKTLIPLRFLKKMKTLK